VAVPFPDQRNILLANQSIKAKELVSTYLFIQMHWLLQADAENKMLKKTQNPSIRPTGSRNLRFLSPQPDTSLHCQTMDMG